MRAPLAGKLLGGFSLSTDELRPQRQLFLVAVALKVGGLVEIVSLGQEQRAVVAEWESQVASARLEHLSVLDGDAHRDRCTITL